MKNSEALMLCKYVQACCPQQKFDEYTPDAWADLLEDVPFDVAKVAAKEVAKRQAFVSPSEILEALARIRRAVRAEIRHEWKVDRAMDDPEIRANAELYEEISRDWVAWQQKKSIEIGQEADQRIAAGFYDLRKVNLTGEEDHDWQGFPRAGDVTRRADAPALGMFERLAIEA